MWKIVRIKQIQELLKSDHWFLIYWYFILSHPVQWPCRLCPELPPTEAIDSSKLTWYGQPLYAYAAVSSKLSDITYSSRDIFELKVKVTGSCNNHYVTWHQEFAYTVNHMLTLFTGVMQWSDKSVHKSKFKSVLKCIVIKEWVIYCFEHCRNLDLTKRPENLHGGWCVWLLPDLVISVYEAHWPSC